MEDGRSIELLTLAGHYRLATGAGSQPQYRPEMAAGESHRTLIAFAILRFSGPLGEPTPAPAILVPLARIRTGNLVVLSHAPLPDWATGA